jgi:hypothetical protein
MTTGKEGGKKISFFFKAGLSLSRETFNYFVGNQRQTSDLVPTNKTRVVENEVDPFTALQVADVRFSFSVLRIRLIINS